MSHKFWYFPFRLGPCSVITLYVPFRQLQAKPVVEKTKARYLSMSVQRSSSGFTWKVVGCFIRRFTASVWVTTKPTVWNGFWIITTEPRNWDKCLPCCWWLPQQKKNKIPLSSANKSSQRTGRMVEVCQVAGQLWIADRRNNNKIQETWQREQRASVWHGEQGNMVTFTGQKELDKIRQTTKWTGIYIASFER